MMTSPRYQHLCDRVSVLGEHLLPAAFSETGEYADEGKVAVQALSFRVLSHAEIESYFEDRVIEIAKSALVAWKERQQLSRALMCMVGFSERVMHKPPETLAAPGQNKVKVWPSRLDPSIRIEECVASFVGGVSRENHGVREKNLLAMLLPIGVDHGDLDPVLLANFDTFGKSRGEAAHTSAAVKRVVDPKDELAVVQNLIAGIESIDSIMDRLLDETVDQAADEPPEVVIGDSTAPMISSPDA